MAESINTCKLQLKDHPAMPQFIKRTMLGFVFIANKLERTLPAGYEDFQTYKLLEELISDEPGDPQFPEGPVQHTWPAEGGGSKEQARQQLLQFGRAVQYLCYPLKSPLTVADICMAHKIMMWGAMEDGHLLAAGEFRLKPSHSGTGYVYPEPEVIPGRLQHIISSYNAKLSSGQVPSYILAADLLYEFVTLHPFQNGNGRMCRLLAAYAAKAAGEPFLLHLSNGHGKTRSHYEQVLRHADKHQGNTARLRSYILDCLHLQWQNAVQYARE
jgi:Fic family protein